MGASGGMEILWKKGLFKPIFSLRGVGFMGINILWKSIYVNLVNIYAPCNAVSRRDIWKDLLARKNKSSNVEWCIGGDFNEVTSREEQLGDGEHFNRR